VPVFDSDFIIAGEDTSKKLFKIAVGFDLSLYATWISVGSQSIFFSLKTINLCL